MFLHLHFPGFQAFAHQVHERDLRRHPVVVVVSEAPDAPVLSCSHEAWSYGLRPGLRLPEAQHLCPGVIPVLPNADRARSVQADVCAAAMAYSPLVASTPGRWDLDLDGSEEFWCTRLIAGRDLNSAVGQARIIAQRIQERIADYLGRAPFIGIGAHPLAARLAARLAAQQSDRSGISLIRKEDEERAIDPLPVHDLPAGVSLLDQLVFMECMTIGDVKRLGLDGLATIGGTAGRALHAAITGQDLTLPASLDGEAHLSACAAAGVGGADEKTVMPLLHSIAQQVGHQLRRHQVAATRLTLSVKWGMGSARQVSMTPTYQVRSNRDLIHAAECLLVKAGEDRLPWSWLRLTATGLVEAEEQHDIFSLHAPPWYQRQELSRVAGATDKASRSFGPTRGVGG